MSEKASVIEKKILTGSMWKTMFALSWPAVIAMILYGGNSVLDAFFVGQFVGEDALSGVSLAYPLSSFTLAFGTMIGGGGAAVLSIAIGAKNKEVQTKILDHVNTYCLICGILFTIFGLLLAEPLVYMMGARDAVLAEGTAYFQVTLIGSVFWIYSLANNLIVRAEGSMAKAAAIMGTGLAVNAVASYVLITVFGMGITGAAWGTNIGMLSYSLIGMWYFKSGKASFKCEVFGIGRDKQVLKDVFRLGFPSFIMAMMGFVQSLVVFNALSIYGTSADIAYYGVVSRLVGFLMTPMMGLMRAAQPMFGMNYGAKNYLRVIEAYKVFSLTALLLCAPAWIITMISPELLTSTMFPGEITPEMGNFMRVYMLTMPMLSYVMMGMTLFPSIDDPKPAAIIGIARQLVFYLPVMIIAPMFFGVSAIYYGSFAIDAVVTVWALLMVKSKFKKLRNMAASEVAENAENSPI